MINVDNASVWAAYGVIATAVIYVVLGVFAYSQVRESRRSRQVHIRPIVIVEPSFQSSLVHFSIRNVGTTPAYNVSVKQTTAIVPSGQFSGDWMRTALFSPSGMPMLGPDQQIRYLLGDYMELEEAGRGMRSVGKISYRSIDGVTYQEKFDVDLAIYRNARLDRAGLPELVSQVKNVDKTLKKLQRDTKRIERSLNPPPTPEINLTSGAGQIHPRAEPTTPVEVDGDRFD